MLESGGKSFEYCLMQFSALLAAMVLAQSLLSASVLLARKIHRSVYAPLIGFFVANAITELPTIFEVSRWAETHPGLQHAADLVSIPFFLLLAPMLWFYVRGLTATSETRYQRKDLWHLLPFVYGLALVVYMMATPFEFRDQILGDAAQQASPGVVIVILAMLLLVLLWVLHASGIIVALFKRLTKHRARLRDFFASTEDQELRWIYGVVMLLGANVLLISFNMFNDDDDIPVFVHYTTDVLNLALTWVLALWGLRQRPITATIDYRLSDPPESSEQEKTAKYQRSALSKDRMRRIAEKIEANMTQSKTYLDSNLSLPDLAEKVGVPPNYVSQTINSHLGQSFFDYVNSKRVVEAKKLLVNSDAAIVDIACEVGFNSRSSFYKYFKHKTGLTPAAWRNQHQNKDPD